MAKKKKDTKKAPPLHEVPKKLQVWGLQETQKAVLAQAQNRYATEAKVITDYQQDNWKRLVVAIAKEVGVPDDINVRLDFQKGTLTEVPAPLVQSPITQDLTKKPA